jgi:peptidoglycan hydrolase-like protein with peptidoglycan-binding domain
MKKIPLLLCFPIALFAQATTNKDAAKLFCIKALQMALKAKGFYEGKFTNKWDEETKKAFVKFANSEGIPLGSTTEYSFKMINEALEYAKFEQFCE